MSANFPFQAVEVIKQRIGNFKPLLGIILGTGSGDVAQQVEPMDVINYPDLPGFVECSVAGHQGQMVFGYLAGYPVVCLKGRVHFYEGYEEEKVRTLVRTLRLLGCEKLVLTNAAASLRPEVGAGRIVLIHNHINLQFKNPLVGENDERFGPRFPDLSYAYSPELRKKALKAAQDHQIELVEGVYMAVLGPCYETPAEIRAFRTLGADLVGMSTVPEVIIARHCGLEVLAFSIVTNMGAGMSQGELNHEEVLEIGQKAAKDLSAILLGVVKTLTC